MNESNQVILTRFFTDTKQLDVFLNGKYLYTFEDAENLPWQLIDFLEQIGYRNFEKQMYEKRWYGLDEI
jgi:hypothetical protein